MARMVIVLIYTVALLAAGLYYLLKRYDISREEAYKVVARNVFPAVLSITAILVLITGECAYLASSGKNQTLLLARWATLIIGLLVVSTTDYREKIIPNKVLIAMFCIRVCFLCAEIAMVPDYVKQAALYPLFGGLIGGWIILIARFFSKKGAGMGDVKLFGVIGFYVGSSEILPTLFWCFFASALVGITLLITKKAGTQDSLPMAPFALAGVLIKFAFFALGG